MADIPDLVRKHRKRRRYPLKDSANNTVDGKIPGKVVEKDGE